MPQAALRERPQSLDSGYTRLKIAYPKAVGHGLGTGYHYPNDALIRRFLAEAREISAVMGTRKVLAYNFSVS